MRIYLVTGSKNLGCKRRCSTLYIIVHLHPVNSETSAERVQGDTHTPSRMSAGTARWAVGAHARAALHLPMMRFHQEHTSSLHSKGITHVPRRTSCVARGMLAARMRANCAPNARHFWLPGTSNTVWRSNATKGDHYNTADHYDTASWYHNHHRDDHDYPFDRDDQDDQDDQDHPCETQAWSPTTVNTASISLLQVYHYCKHHCKYHCKYIITVSISSL